MCLERDSNYTFSTSKLMAGNSLTLCTRYHCSLCVRNASSILNKWQHHFNLQNMLLDSVGGKSSIKLCNCSLKVSLSSFIKDYLL